MSILSAIGTDSTIAKAEGGLDAIIQKALAQVPGLEDHAAQRIQETIVAAIKDADPILQRVDAIVSAIDRVTEAIEKAQLMFAKFAGGMVFQAGFVPKPAAQAVSLDAAALPDVKA